MKDIFHQALFLFGALITITLLRLILGPWVRFLGTTNILLYLILDGVLLLIVLILYLIQRKHQ